MLDFEGEKKRSNVVGLQLAPMIDVFVLIIVFLIRGTVMEDTPVQKPVGLNLAQSISKERSEASPEVIIMPNQVEFKLIKQTRPIEQFKEDDFNPQDPIFQAFKKFQDENKNVENSRNISVISDRSVSYKTLYNVVKVLRVSGFQSMLFVAEGEGQ